MVTAALRQAEHTGVGYACVLLLSLAGLAGSKVREWPALLELLACTTATEGCCHLLLLCRLIDELVRVARQQGCYKVILDCAEHNIPFYEKCGLSRKEVQMVRSVGSRI